MALLEVDRVTAGYGVAPDILNGVTLEIDSGQRVCIIGPNGAGKSTLLKVICGLLRPRSGRIRLDGVDITGLRPDQTLRRGLCFVPQDRTLFPQMTVRENLRMGGYLERDRHRLDERLDRALDVFAELRDQLSQRAGTLSGGQQQMLALARAMMLEPSVMMIDEPSLGLAPRLSARIFETIRRLADLGIAIVLVEQNARRGLECAERGVVLDLGVKRFEGRSEDILSDPRIRELYLGRQLAARDSSTEHLPGSASPPGEPSGVSERGSGDVR
jgi:branched-chain amino acid transport system ATP-binding protein